MWLPIFHIHIIYFALDFGLITIFCFFAGTGATATSYSLPFEVGREVSPYIRRAGLLPLAWVVNEGLPPMDGALLTAFVDRWRPETHTFHLPCGEMTVTLQDVAMILGLPLDGPPVTGIVQSDGWRDMVENIIGIRPPAPLEGVRDWKTLGVSSA